MVTVENRVQETIRQLEATDALVRRFYQETPLGQNNSSWISRLYCFVHDEGYIPSLTEVLNEAIGSAISDAITKAPRYLQTGGSLFAGTDSYVLVQTIAHKHAPEWSAVAESIVYTEKVIIERLGVRTALELDPQAKTATLAFCPVDADFALVLGRVAAGLIWWRDRIWLRDENRLPEKIVEDVWKIWLKQRRTRRQEAIKPR